MSLDAELRAAFNGELVLPGDPDYANAIARWATNAERKARYVTFPKDTQAVSAIVNWAVSNNIPIAVKGGGHSASGSSSSEDGLVIDLGRHLNKVTVSEDKKVFFIGGGALWEDVDRAGVENGVATVSSCCFFFGASSSAVEMTARRHRQSHWGWRVRFLDR